MKKILAIWFILVFVVGTALADPHLTCDPQPGVTKYRLVCASIGIDEVSDANADTTAWHDLAGIPEGDHDCLFYAGKEWILDGVPQGVYKWSEVPNPFVLGNPSTAGNPQNKRLQ